MSIRAFRCQLPRENKFFPFESTELDSWLVDGVHDFPKTCILCGLKSRITCDKCSDASFCSHEHLSLHTATCGGGLSPLTACFPEYDLLVEPEESTMTREEKEEEERAFIQKSTVWDGAITPDDDLDDTDDEEDAGPKDADLTQNDYNAALGNESPDPIYRKFLNRIRQGGADQVLRYSMLLLCLSLSHSHIHVLSPNLSVSPLPLTPGSGILGGSPGASPFM